MTQKDFSLRKAEALNGIKIGICLETKMTMPDAIERFQNP